MKRTLSWGIVVTTLLVLALPFVGGSGPSFLTPATAAEAAANVPVAASTVTATNADAADVSVAAAAITIAADTDSVVALKPPPANSKSDSEHVAQKPVPVPLAVTESGAASGTTERQATLAAQGLSCPSNVTGTTGSAPSKTSAKGVAGTTTADLTAFAVKYNQIRVANCLSPVPMANFRYDSCMETRLFWMAEDPSTDPSSAWGHIGSQRSDGVPSVGCDGNLAGGMSNTGTTVAQKWWDSTSHRASLYKPSYTGSTATVCVYFAMTHGGVPNEPYAFTRAAARWGTC